MKRFGRTLECIGNWVLYFLLHSLPIISPLLHLWYVKKVNSLGTYLKKNYGNAFIQGQYKKPIIYIDKEYDIDSIPKKILSLQVISAEIKNNKAYITVVRDKKLDKIKFFDNMKIEFVKKDESEIEELD